MNESYFAVIHDPVLYDTDLNDGCVRLYGIIQKHCGKEGYCWATNDYLSNKIGRSKSCVSKWIQELINKNYLISKIIYKPNSKEIKERRMFINIQPALQMSQDPLVPTADTSSTSSVDPMLQTSEDNIEKININNINNIRGIPKNGLGVLEGSPKKKTLKDLMKDYTEDPKIRIALQTFIDHYKGLTKIYPSIQQFEKLLEELTSLANISPNPEEKKLELINLAVLRGWRGFYKDPNDAYNRGSDNMSSQQKESVSKEDRQLADEEF